MAIQNVLSNLLDTGSLQILKEAQLAVDAKTNQDAAHSYMHSMTGLIKKGDTTNVQARIFIKLAEDFVRSNLVAALRDKHSGNTHQALMELGQAIHTLSDATSPAHEGFQPWAYNESTWAKAQHVLKERIYPDNQGQKSYRDALEGAVRWAYNIYLEKTNMPAHFFEASGKLAAHPP